MSNLREESAHYEQQLTRQVHSVLDSLKLENILAGLRNFFRHQLWRRRTLYALGAAFVVFLVLKGMLGGRRRVKVLAGSTGEGEGALVVEHKSSGGFWSRLIQDAIRTFLLSYARKVLMDYIARKTEQRAD
ncbi:MAG: hypothetical protein KF690_11375 [Bacteroidetes bacterium]|nr:hypothetical protein [Bacteroidota bacterium]